MLDGKYDHRHPYPGDGGVQFEAKDEGIWQRSLCRQLMDGELEGTERMPEVYALRAQEVKAAAEKRDRALAGKS